MSQEINSSILEKVDVFFTRIFRGLFNWSWAICLFIMGVSALYFQFMVIFGNNAGLSDVSTVEFVFFVIIAGLIWRHCYYAKLNSQSIFMTMAKIIMNVGIVNVVFLALAAVMFFVIYSEGESLDEFMLTFFVVDYLDDLIEMAFWIFVFYVSAPIDKNNKILQTVKVEKNDSKLKTSELNSSEIEQSLSAEQETVERKEGNENETKV